MDDFDDEEVSVEIIPKPTPLEIITKHQKDVEAYYAGVLHFALQAVAGKNGAELQQYIEQMCTCCATLKWMAKRGLEAQGLSGDDSFQLVENASAQTFSKFLSELCKAHSSEMVQYLYHAALKSTADRAIFPFPNESPNQTQEWQKKRIRRNSRS